MYEYLQTAYAGKPALDIILELLAFILGILSVWFAKRENIAVYPSGLIATVITCWLLYKAGYFGDMLVNAYFSIMSVYGWYMWARKGNDGTSLPISRTSRKQKLTGIFMFCITIFVVFSIYTMHGQQVNTDHYVDILASGIFFTGMWFMALKKIENWTLWIIGDIIVTPLYAYRDLWMLSLQYLIFTILAIAAYIEWRNILNNRTLSS
jgi:nicotinamide mononucleotide transporter